LVIRRRFWGGSRQQELIPCTAHAAQPESIQFQGVIEMRKQHLDFFRSLRDCWYPPDFSLDKPPVLEVAVLEKRHIPEASSK
jgi:hypothetical protein